jgi:hypothetical protein
MQWHITLPNQTLEELRLWKSSVKIIRDCFHNSSKRVNHVVVISEVVFRFFFPQEYCNSSLIIYSLSLVRGDSRHPRKIVYLLLRSPHPQATQHDRNSSISGVPYISDVGEIKNDLEKSKNGNSKSFQ